jgi:hypothetical protein
MRGRRLSTSESSTGFAEIARRHKRSSSLQETGTPTALQHKAYHRIREASYTLSSLHGQSLHDFIFRVFKNIESPIFDTWLAEPLFVTDEQLCEISDVEECNSSSPPMRNLSTCYYRSWAVSMDQFQAVVRDLESKGQDVQHYKMALLHPNRSATVTIRYLGQTNGTGTQNVWLRSLRTVRIGSPMGLFQESLKTLFPGIQYRPRVFRIKKSEIHFFNSNNETLSYLGSEYLTFQMERALISMFKLSTLLNEQAGGQLSDNGIGPDCDQILAGCRTSLLTKIDGAQISDPGIQTTESIVNSFRSWWNYAQESEWNDELSKLFINSTISQALPKQVNGITLAVIGGLEPPSKTVIDGACFLSGRRESGRRVKDALELIGSLELGIYPRRMKSLYSLIGFNQLFNLPKLGLSKEGRKRCKVSQSCQRKPSVSTKESY